MRMIEKMKITIKKKKAFTLVELMGVLVIIGVLSAVLIPVISNVLKENKEKAYQSQLQNITLAAKNFVSDNRFLMPEEEGESISITLGQLKRTGYAVHSIVNPKTKEEISNCLQIDIQKVNNNYEYVIEENTIKVNNCNEEYNSDILISGPSKTYIKKGEISSYILMLNSSDENKVLGYNFDYSKLSLGTTDAKYSVVGENGIYKILIQAGEKEDEINLTFKEDAITDTSGNNVDMSEVVYGKIIVDNTGPVITFTNNGSSSYTNNVSTNINVQDAKSGNDATTYKYIFSDVKSTAPTKAFTLETAVNHTTGNGSYYLIASACDKLGNCTKEISNYFNMDTLAPSIPTISLVYEDNNQAYNQSWTNRSVKQRQSSTDSGAGGVYYQYSHDNSSWTSMPQDWVISWEGSWYFYVRACDSLGNCSSSAPRYWIGLDLCQSTTSSTGSWSNCSKPCGTGTKTQTTTYYGISGKVCNTTTKTENCNTDPCFSITSSGNMNKWVCAKCRSACDSYAAKDASGNCIYTVSNQYGNTVGKLSYSNNGTTVTFNWEIRQGGASYIGGGYWVKFVIKNSAGTEIYSQYLKESAGTWSASSVHSGSISYTFTSSDTYYIDIDGNSTEPTFDMRLGTLAVQL